jgi:signal transduction histidine kinase
VLPDVLAEVVEQWQADGALMMASDPGGSMLRVAASYPAAPRQVAEALRLPVGFGVIGRVAETGQAVRLDHDSPRDPLHRRVLGLAEGAVVARLCLPLTGLAGRVMGVLGLHRAPGRPFDDAALEAALPLAAGLGLRLHAEWLDEQERHSVTQRDELIARAISAQEAERRRIAGDLHDGVTQALVSLDYHLSAASASMAAGDAEQAATEVATARTLSGLAYDETRAAISGLHSLILDDLGLTAALESLVQWVNSSSEVAASFQQDPDPAFDDLPDHIGAALYRIAQEALNNAVKHAGATSVALSLRRVGSSTVLAVTDDGAGFDVEAVRSRSLARGDAEHFGLSSIAERCALLDASLRIDSAQGRGTAVIVELPT